MRIAILTNEYPPHVYGGAGVHVEYLTRELARLDGGQYEIKVVCFGDQQIQDGNLTVQGVPAPQAPETEDPRHRKFLDTILRDALMAGEVGSRFDIVHCHTWYSHFAGCLVKQLAGAKLVLTTHSLEPHRPWKVEQLGTAYQASTWLERTAYQNADGVVAVSQAMRQDVHDLYGVPLDRIRVIANGIDLSQYRPSPDREVLVRYGIDPDRPFILFVGRITRQKGIIHLVRAARLLNPGVQLVLCAGAPDTPEIGREMEAEVARARQESRVPICWIPQVLPKPEIIALYSMAALFVCPSVYEPFGIINLEAMACQTPVVASAVGGIREVVVDGETGILVPFEPLGPTDFEPRDPGQFAADLARAMNQMLADPRTLEAMGERSRLRVEALFSWTSIARATLDFYRDLCEGTDRSHRSAGSTA